MSTSVFFTVCGIEPDEACVIERTPHEAVRRSLSDGVITQANHHVSARFASNNDDLHNVPEGEEEFSLEGSTLRSDGLACALKELREPRTLEEAAAVLDAPGVLNKMTCQQMAFCPRTGDVRVWRRMTPPAS
jgi:hypothetical protein